MGLIRPESSTNNTSNGHHQSTRFMIEYYAIESGTSSQQPNRDNISKNRVVSVSGGNSMEKPTSSRINTRQIINGSSNNSSYYQSSSSLADQVPAAKTMVLNRTNGAADNIQNHGNYHQHQNGYNGVENGSSEMSRKSREYSHRNNNKYKSGGNRHDDTLLLQRPTILAKPAVVLTNSRSPVSTVPSSNDQETGKRGNGSSNGSVPVLNSAQHVHKDENSRPDSISDRGTKILAGKNGLTAASMTAVNNILTPTKTVGRDSTDKSDKPAATPLSAFVDSIHGRLCAEPRHMTTALKLLDEDLQWHDTLAEHLTDQTDYVVVGVLGKKGVGKSTVMSLLGGTPTSRVTAPHNASCIFRTASKDAVEQAQSRTSGVNAFITAERTILLDVQPLLCGSILDRTITQADKRHFSVDFKYFENYVEVESLELACFVLSVCNVVIVAEDWFADPNLLRLLQTAEMLMPNMNLTSSSGSSNASSTPGPDDLNYDHHPHLVYLLNKSELHSRLDVFKMKSCINSLMKDSKLMYKGSISDLSGLSSSISLMDSGSSKLKKRTTPDDSESVNFVVLPKLELSAVTSNGNKKDTNEEPASEFVSTEFKGLPSMDRCVRNLLHELLTIKRAHASFTTGPSLTTQHQQQQLGMGMASLAGGQFISEKRWFSYAAKVWETIRKSPLIAEYNRLMT